MSSFKADFISVGLTKILIIVSSLLTSIIIARKLGPEMNGTIATLLVYPSLFMSIGSLGIRQSTTYFLGKNIFTQNQIKTAISQIWILSSVVSLLVCFYLITYFSKSGDNILLVVLAILPIPFVLFNTYNSGIFLGLNEINSFNKVTWIPKLGILIFTFVFVVWFSFDIAGYLFSLILGPLFIFFILLFNNKFIQSFSFKIEWFVVRKMLGLGLVYAFALLIISLNYKIDIILLDYLSSSYETGIYARGIGITEYLWQIPMILSTIVFARSAVSKDDKKFSIKLAQLLRLSFIAILFGALLLYHLSHFIVVGMYGDEFIGSVSVLNILLPGVIILTIFKVINMDLAGKGKPWVSLKAMLPALLLNIVLNMYFIPIYGAKGAALASTISYSIAGVLFLYFYSKEVQIPISIILKYKKTDFDPVIQILKNQNNK